MNQGYSVERSYPGSKNWVIVGPNGAHTDSGIFPTKGVAVDYLSTHDIAAEQQARAEKERRRQIEHARYIAKHNHPEYTALHGMSALRSRLDKVVEWGNEYVEKCPSHAVQFRAFVADAAALQRRIGRDMLALDGQIEHELNVSITS